MILYGRIITYFSTSKHCQLSFDRIQLWFVFFIHRISQKNHAKRSENTEWSLMRDPINFCPVLLIFWFLVFHLLLYFICFSSKYNQQFLQDYKNLHFHCVHQKKPATLKQKKNLGNFCELHTRDNWFDWNETKIWGNIEKWERAKVRSVDKTANWLNQSHIILLTK